MGEKLAILDAGAQYGKVIDRKVRELEVESRILPLNTPLSELEEYKAVIISGGPKSVYGKDAPEHNPWIFETGKPVLGICYGMQLLNHVYRGSVSEKLEREDGPYKIKVDNESPLFSGLSSEERVLLTHGDSIDEVAEGFTVTARSNGLISGIENTEKDLYGVQFHPEVDLTENGQKILHNFLYDISGFSGDYTMEDRVGKAIKDIRRQAGDKNVVLLASGGVDSTVCSALLNKALDKEKVYQLHFDNGFMRLGESKNVKNALNEVGVDLKVINAREDFYNATTKINDKRTNKLNETIDPEEKRHIIGDTFMKLASKEIENLELSPKNTYLVQGTLRPDLIESASKKASDDADTIKTHHNDTELVRELRDKGKVIEPLTEYHKDEVRKLGRMLGLSESVVNRQPFPGPGLAIRTICAEKPYITDEFESINEQLKKFSTADVNATLLPIQTVGVQGDGRSYSYLAGLSGKRDWDELFRLTKDIPRNIHEINRLVYVFGDKIESPVTEITPTHLTPDVLEQLRTADDAVNKTLTEYNLVKKISQVPVTSFPVNFGTEGKRSIGIRTFVTNDFMTGVAAVPGKDYPEEALEVMVERVLEETSGVARVAYDLTSKPPGTTEWE